MRISDWSSDVCSSDLHLRFVLKLPHLVVDLLQRADRGQRVLDQVGRVNHRPLRLRGRQRAEQSGSDGRKRSEEHTSELQSLMRTSYAVFCLKKKTTTLNPDK